MSNGSEVAEQMVSIGLKGSEMILKLTGAGALKLATYLTALLKDQKRLKGKTGIERMLREGKEIKIFQVKKEDLKAFHTSAKQYGVLYAAIRDKKNNDGIIDLLVRADDASKINRVMERISYGHTDIGSIRAEIISDQAQASAQDVKKKQKEQRSPEPPATQSSSSERNGEASESLSEPKSPGRSLTRNQQRSSERGKKPSVMERLNQYREQSKQQSASTARVKNKAKAKSADRGR